MQRWILVTVIGVFVVGLAVAGAGYAWWNSKQNADASVWAALPINPELPEEQRDAVADEIRRHVSEPELLAAVAKEHGTTRQLGLGSDEETADYLLTRLFVRVGEVETGMGTAPAVLIGFNGTRREFKTLGAAATGLMNRVLVLVSPPSE